MISTGIALIPDVATIREVMRIQQAAQMIVPLEPILGEDEYLPHITLLQGNSDSPLASDELLDQLAHMLLTTPPQLSIAGASYVNRGWYFLDVRQLPLLDDMHELAFRCCRSRMIPPASIDKVSINGYTPSQVQNYTAYGYRYIGSDFRPHITMGRTLDKRAAQRDAELLDLLSKLSESLSFSVSSFTSYCMGVNGGHLRAIATRSINRF